MPATIESLPAKWMSDAAKQVYDLLQAEIAKAFEPPRPAGDTWGPQEFADFKRHAFATTEWMLEQCVRLHAEFTVPVFILHLTPSPPPPPGQIIKTGA